MGFYNIKILDILKNAFGWVRLFGLMAYQSLMVIQYQILFTHDF